MPPGGSPPGADVPRASPGLADGRRPESRRTRVDPRARRGNRRPSARRTEGRSPRGPRAEQCRRDSAAVAGVSPPLRTPSRRELRPLARMERGPRSAPCSTCCRAGRRPRNTRGSSRSRRGAAAALLRRKRIERDGQFPSLTPHSKPISWMAPTASAVPLPAKSAATSAPCSKGQAPLSSPKWKHTSTCAIRAAMS